MQISDEAVEAAAKVLFEQLWENAHESQRAYARDEARDALEAAAPYMMVQAQADAWDKAWAHARGNYSAVYTQRPIPDWVTLTNPYRSQA